MTPGSLSIRAHAIPWLPPEATTTPPMRDRHPSPWPIAGPDAFVRTHILGTYHLLEAWLDGRASILFPFSKRTTPP